VLDSNGLSEGIIRTHVKLIEYHGKAGYDAAGNVPKNAVGDAILSGAMLNPGTRDLVLYLAKHKPGPSVDKADKTGWEAPGRYIWAFYDTAKFTKFTVPDSDGFKGGRDHHEFVGLCRDRQRAVRDGPLHVRMMFCACDPCLLLDFDRCEMRSVVGRMVRREAPLPRGRAPAPQRPKEMCLEDWTDALDDGQLVAESAGEDGQGDSEVYSLARLCGKAFAVPEDMCHCAQQFSEGILVAPGQRYVLRQRSERGYELLLEKVWLPVEGMIRLKGLTFSSSQSGPQQRQLRQTATGQAAASRAKGSGLSFLSEDTHNAILEATGANAADSDEPLPPPSPRAGRHPAPSTAPTPGGHSISIQVVIPQGHLPGGALKITAPVGGAVRVFHVVTPVDKLPGETVRISVRMDEGEPVLSRS